MKELLAAVGAILRRHGQHSTDVEAFIQTFDGREHELEQLRPHISFREVSRRALARTSPDFELPFDSSDGEILTTSSAKMPPFSDVVGTLGDLKSQGFKLCIISNTDDDIIAGNIAQLGGHIDRVVTAQQAQAYKPSRQIFAIALDALGVNRSDVVHICASPHLDLVAARDIGFRCIWIDRGTGRKAPTDYVPDFVFPTLDKVPALFAELGWA
jgi:2-haloacid dehalogenase